MLTAIMAADQGTDAMAAHQVGMNIMALSFAFGDGLQATAVALIGRSLGSGDPDLAKEYGRTCRLIGAVIAVCLVAIYYFGASGLYHLFFTEDHIVAIGVQIMHVIIFVVIFQICQVIYMGCLRGAGDTLYTAVGIHDKRHFHPYHHFLFLWLCPRLGDHRYLDGRAGRSGFQICLCDRALQAGQVGEDQNLITGV